MCDIKGAVTYTQQYLTICGVERSKNGSPDCCLAGSTFAHETKALTRIEIKADAIDCPDIACNTVENATG
jgi:hypothetical protein